MTREEIDAALDSFQEDIHLTGAGRNVIDLNWIYFLND